MIFLSFSNWMFFCFLNETIQCWIILATTSSSNNFYRWLKPSEFYSVSGEMFQTRDSYQSNVLKKAEFVFILMVIPRTVDFLIMISWRNWFCVARMIKVFAIISKSVISTGVCVPISNIFSKNSSLKKTATVKPAINNTNTDVGVFGVYKNNKSGSN